MGNKDDGETTKGRKIMCEKSAKLDKTTSKRRRRKREREELEIGKISTQHKWENYVIFRKHKGSCELVRRRKTRERES